MKKRMYMILALVLLVCLGMTACAGDVEESPDQGLKLGYSVEVRDGKYYLVFDDITAYNTPSEDFILEVGVLEFPSMQDFKDAMTTGTLTEGEKRTIARAFQKDETGAVRLPDLENLFVPVLPKDGNNNRMIWKGQLYSFDLGFENGVSGTFEYCNRTLYRTEFKNNYTNLFDKSGVKVHDVTTLEDGIVVTTYSNRSGEYKCIQFDFTDDDKTVYVAKWYCLSTNYEAFPGAISSVIPARIKLYCTERDQYYTLHLSGFAEDPTDEWLMEFGIEKFVDTSLETE